MKILESGKKEFVVVCPTCGCKFSYTIEEFRSRWPLQYMLCPDCENSVYHPDQSIGSDKSLEEFISDSVLKNI